MHRTFLTLLLAAGAAAADQAQSAPVPQEPVPQEDASPIVVQGVRIQEKEVDRFVEALTDAPFSRQISRFDWAVCPAAAGLGQAQNDAIAQRLRKVAEAAGLSVGRPGCRANMLLFITRGKGRLIEQLERQYPAYFEGLERAEVLRLIRDTSPATAWHVEGLLDADGVEVPRDRLTGQYIIERSDSPSRTRTSTRPHFVAAMVAVELDSLAGLTLTQLADYAAMRAFTRSDPAKLGRTAAPTILTVIGSPMDSAVPVTLTQWDLALLKSLYASDPNKSAATQRSDIKQRVRKELRDGQPRN